MKQGCFIIASLIFEGVPLKPVLLSILEIGGYPDFSKYYHSLGFEFKQVASMRKGIQYIKKNKVDVIVAEFNYQSDFRDRTSQLETLMAAIQPKPEIKVIVFYDKEQSHQLQRLTSRFDALACVAYPISTDLLEQAFSLFVE